MFQQDLAKKVKEILKEKSINDALDYFFENNQDNSKENLIISLRDQLRRLDDLSIRGQVSPTEKHRMENQIYANFLNLIKEIETTKSIEPKIDPVKVSPRNFQKKRLNLIKISIVIFLLFFSLIYTQRHLFITLEKEVQMSLITLNEKLILLADKQTSSSRKDQLSNEILKAFPSETKVILKGKHGTVINIFELEDFLNEISFGSFSNTSVQSTQDDEIVIKNC